MMRAWIGKVFFMGLLTYFMYQNRYRITRWLIGWAGLRRFLQSQNINISGVTNWLKQQRPQQKQQKEH